MLGATLILPDGRETVDEQQLLSCYRNSNRNLQCALRVIALQFERATALTPAIRAHSDTVLSMRRPQRITPS